jgi:hypothetical protein
LFANSGRSFKLKNLNSSQFLGCLMKIEEQRMVREKSTSILRLGDIWISVDLNVRACCTQLYKLELDNRINIRDKILRIVSFS